jgi:hypothetical protein
MARMRAAICLLLASCATDSTRLSDEDATNVAMSIASSLQPVAGGGELGAMRDIDDLVRGQLPAGFVVEESAVRGQHGGLTYGYRFACRDAHNRAVECDVRTENADVDASWSGVIATAVSMTVASREGSWILNDITKTKLRLDGEAHFEYASTVGDNAFALSYDASYRNVQIARGEAAPRTGLVRYALTSARTQHGERHEFLVDADVRFHAGGRATIVLPDHAFDVDLTRGTVVARHCDGNGPCAPSASDTNIVEFMSGPAIAEW